MGNKIDRIEEVKEDTTNFLINPEFTEIDIDNEEQITKHFELINLKDMFFGFQFSKSKLRKFTEMMYFSQENNFANLLRGIIFEHGLFGIEADYIKAVKFYYISAFIDKEPLAFYYLYQINFYNLIEKNIHNENLDFGLSSTFHKSNDYSLFEKKEKKEKSKDENVFISSNKENESSSYEINNFLIHKKLKRLKDFENSEKHNFEILKQKQVEDNYLLVKKDESSTFMIKDFIREGEKLLNISLKSKEEYKEYFQLDEFIKENCFIRNRDLEMFLLICSISFLPPSIFYIKENYRGINPLHTLALHLDLEDKTLEKVSSLLKKIITVKEEKEKEEIKKFIYNEKSKFNNTKKEFKSKEEALFYYLPFTSKDVLFVKTIFEFVFHKDDSDYFSKCPYFVIESINYINFIDDKEKEIQNRNHNILKEAEERIKLIRKITHSPEYKEEDFYETSYYNYYQKLVYLSKCFSNVEATAHLAFINSNSFVRFFKEDKLYNTHLSTNIRLKFLNKKKTFFKNGEKVTLEENTQDNLSDGESIIKNVYYDNAKIYFDVLRANFNKVIKKTSSSKNKTTPNSTNSSKNLPLSIKFIGKKKTSTKSLNYSENNLSVSVASNDSIDSPSMSFFSVFSASLVPSDLILKQNSKKYLFCEAYFHFNKNDYHRAIDVCKEAISHCNEKGYFMLYDLLLISIEYEDSYENLKKIGEECALLLLQDIINGGIYSVYEYFYLKRILKKYYDKTLPKELDLESDLIDLLKLKKENKINWMISDVSDDTKAEFSFSLGYILYTKASSKLKENQEEHDRLISNLNNLLINYNSFLKGCIKKEKSNLKVKEKEKESFTKSKIPSFNSKKDERGIKKCSINIMRTQSCKLEKDENSGAEEVSSFNSPVKLQLQNSNLSSNNNFNIFRKSNNLSNSNKENVNITDNYGFNLSKKRSEEIRNTQPTNKKLIESAIFQNIYNLSNVSPLNINIDNSYEYINYEKNQINTIQTNKKSDNLSNKNEIKEDILISSDGFGLENIQVKSRTKSAFSLNSCCDENFINSNNPNIIPNYNINELENFSLNNDDENNENMEKYLENISNGVNKIQEAINFHEEQSNSELYNREGEEIIEDGEDDDDNDEDSEISEDANLDVYHTISASSFSSNSILNKNPNQVSSYSK